MDIPSDDETAAEFRNLFGPQIGDEIMDNLRRVREGLIKDGMSGVIAGPDGMVTPYLNPPPGLVAMVDQAWKASRDNRADGPQAAAEHRCAKPPMGCGQPLSGTLSDHFRDQKSRREYDITHLCQSCQDLMFAPDPDEVMEMALDTDNYGRCSECGEYRPYEFVDIGVGVIKGFDCCPAMHDPALQRLPRCTRTEGCWFGADHQHGCETTKAYGGESPKDVWG